MNSRTSISILFLLLPGCEEPPAVMPQTSSDAIGQVETTVSPDEPAGTPEGTTEGTIELTIAAAEQANEITGKVVGIMDGDTIDILIDNKTKIRIRLNGIDAPETGQPFGRNAKQYLSEKTGGQVVRVVTHGEDRYGRTIGDVYLEDVPGPNFLPGTVMPDWNINREIVQEGLAWHYNKYSTDINLEMDEITAKNRKAGGGWARVYQATGEPACELAIPVSGSLTEWMRKNSHLRVTHVVPVTATLRRRIVGLEG